MSISALTTHSAVTASQPGTGARLTTTTGRLRVSDATTESGTVPWATARASTLVARSRTAWATSVRWWVASSMRCWPPSAAALSIPWTREE